MDSFFLMGAKPLVQDSPTMKLHELLDWDEIAHKLKGLYKREATHGGGPEPYSALAMFKLMLLGQWHGLSDTQLETAAQLPLATPPPGRCEGNSAMCNPIRAFSPFQDLLSPSPGPFEPLRTDYSPHTAAAARSAASSSP